VDAASAIKELIASNNDPIVRHRLEVFVWEAATASYAPSTASLVLPGLDLSLLEECARMDYASDAIREFDKRIRVTEGG
jgi:hypothetical protein